MHLALSLRVFKESEPRRASIDDPCQTVNARGHADGNQGDWRLVADEGESVGSPPLSLLLSEPIDSPILRDVKR